jgi:hypothetical protein
LPSSVNLSLAGALSETTPNAIQCSVADALGLAGGRGSWTLAKWQTTVSPPPGFTVGAAALPAVAVPNVVKVTRGGRHRHHADPSVRRGDGHDLAHDVCRNNKRTSLASNVSSSSDSRGVPACASLRS